MAASAHPIPSTSHALPHMISISRDPTAGFAINGSIYPATPPLTKGQQKVPAQSPDFHKRALEMKQMNSQLCFYLALALPHPAFPMVLVSGNPALERE